MRGPRARPPRPRRGAAPPPPRPRSGVARWSCTLVDTCTRPRAARRRPIARTPSSPPPDSRIRAATSRASSRSSSTRSRLNAISGGRAVARITPAGRVRAPGTEVRHDLARLDPVGQRAPAALAQPGPLAALGVGGELAVEHDRHLELRAHAPGRRQHLGARRAARCLVEVDDRHHVERARRTGAGPSWPCQVDRVQGRGRARDQTVGERALRSRERVDRAPVVGVGVHVEQRGRARTRARSARSQRESLPSLTLGTATSMGGAAGTTWILPVKGYPWPRGRSAPWLRSSAVRAHHS